MSASSLVFWTVLALVALRWAAQLWLERLNNSETRRWASAPPQHLSGVHSPEAYAQSVRYTLAKGAHGQWEDTFSAVLLIATLVSGVLPWSYEFLAGAGGHARWAETLWIVAVALAYGLVGLPLEWWEQFRLEERFGFNRSTPALWAADKVKENLVALALGTPLCWGILTAVDWAGPTWWVWAFVVFIIFQLLLVVIYPRFIVPIFNKLTPLEEGPLRERLMELASRLHFGAAQIEVIDGSRRSGHSNAYFTGFGRFRRIVLFDTLLSQLSPEELEAVLAHEIGHYKRGHIPKLILMTAGMSLGAFALLGWLSAWPPFLQAFGFAMPAASPAPALLLVLLTGGAAAFWLGPWRSRLARRHEFEADAFAGEAMGTPATLVSALRKLSEKNLSNLTPHPTYARFYHSHPSLAEREQALVART